MKRKTFFISIGLYALLLIVIFTFQGMVLSHLRIDGLTPLLLPLASTAVAVYEGRTAGGVAGLFAGILCDISFGEPVAVFTVLLTFSGIAIGNMVDTVVTRGFVTYFLFGAGVLALSAMIQIVPLIYGGIPPHILMPTVLWQTIYSLIFAFPIWLLVSAIGRRVYKESMRGKPQ